MNKYTIIIKVNNIGLLFNSKSLAFLLTLCSSAFISIYAEDSESHELPNPFRHFIIALPIGLMIVFAIQVMVQLIYGIWIVRDPDRHHRTFQRLMRNIPIEIDERRRYFFQAGWHIIILSLSEIALLTIYLFFYVYFRIVQKG